MYAPQSNPILPKYHKIESYVINCHRCAKYFATIIGKECAWFECLHLKTGRTQKKNTLYFLVHCAKLPYWTMTSSRHTRDHHHHRNTIALAHQTSAVIEMSLNKEQSTRTGERRAMCVAPPPCTCVHTCTFNALSPCRTLWRICPQQKPCHHHHVRQFIAHNYAHADWLCKKLISELVRYLSGAANFVLRWCFLCVCVRLYRQRIEAIILLCAVCSSVHPNI